MTKQAIPFAVLDIWQASGAEGEKGGPIRNSSIIISHLLGVYDYHEDGPERRAYSESVNTHGKAKNYDFRGRVICNELGQYEFETITPQPYLGTKIFAFFFDPATDNNSHRNFNNFFVEHSLLNSSETQVSPFLFLLMKRR